MAGPLLYAGSRTAQLFQIGSGYADGSAVYNLSARSHRMAPAGSNGECIFTRLAVTTRHYTSNVTFWLTPLVDSVALATQQIALVGAATTIGVATTHQLALSLPYVRSSVEILRTAPRGTWFELLIETQYASAIASKQIIESVVLEWDPVRGTQQGEAR